MKPRSAAREVTGAPARCVLHSAIAEGADRYAADAALARGWRLVTPLPFSVERYEEDFPDQESKEHYQRLLWASRRVLPVAQEQGRAHRRACRALRRRRARSDRKGRPVAVRMERPSSERAGRHLRGGGADA